MHAGPGRCRNGIKLADFFILVALLSVARSTTAQTRPMVDPQPGAPDRAHVNAAIDRLPIRFEPLDQNGMFIARTVGASVRLSGRTIDFPAATDSTGTNSIRVHFVGARKSSRVIGIEPLPGRVNYLYGDAPARWRRNVPTYARARTKDLYRGIDVLYYGARDRLEYDLLVRPGARADSIRLAVAGASVAISGAGDLVYGDDHRVLLHKPVAYQTVDGVRRDVTVTYHRRDDGGIGFSVGTYDRRQLLVIDPIIAYSFSFGGSGDEQVYDIAVDETGAVYVGGETYSINFPTVNPAQGRDDAGDACTFYGNSICRDAFLAKVAPDGKSLVYATYFGSADFDQVNHIVVDSAHALYFAGWTTTQTTSPQPDVRNSFIGKLAPDGSQVIYTYYSPRCCVSGPALMINDLAVAPDGSAYVAVSTPATAEIATLSPAGDNYHSIYTLTDPSGVSRTSFNAIAVQGDSVFVGGNTTWSGFPATRYTFGGSRSGVLIRLSLTGSVIYSDFVNLRNALTIADLAVSRDSSVQIVADGSQTDTTCSPSSSAHEVIVARFTTDGVLGDPNGFPAVAAIPYPSFACLLPPIRLALDDQGSAYTAACGYGPGPNESVPRMICNLWRVTPALSTQTFSDVPWHRFTIDRNGNARWFAPVNGQVSIIKVAAQVSLEALIAPPSPAHFGTEIVFEAVIPVADDDIEVSVWRYDTYGGWRQVQESTFFGGSSPLRIPYAWAPAWWDAGHHPVCAFVRLAGSSDQPQSACTNVTVVGVQAGDPPILASPDFNGDLRPDLIWIYSATGELAMWNLGGGAHGERVLNGGYLNAPPLPAGWHAAGTADIDGDGQTDLVLQSDSGYLGAWFFNGSTMGGGTLLTPSQAAPNWQIRAVGDLNHDGHPDLIWQHAPTGQVAFWLMNGTTAIGYVIPDVAAPGGDWEIVGTGDSNRDGERDIFWQHRPTGTLAVWTMKGAQLASASVVIPNPGTLWRAVAVSDLDGDAYADIVLENTNTGDLGVWYLSGNRLRFGVLLVPSSVGTGWNVVGPR